MKIILISAVSKLGKIGDIVEVTNGYAKNFLIPSKKAICFTSANYKVFEAKKAEFEQSHINNLDSASKVKAKVAGKDLVIIENASDDGRLYGSVSSSVIAAKINEMLGEKLVSRADVFLKKPIKEIGVYVVKLNPHSDISFDVRAIVTRSESEIEALLRGGKKNKSEQESTAQESVSDSSSDEEQKNTKPKRIRKKAEVSTEE